MVELWRWAIFSVRFSITPTTTEENGRLVVDQAARREGSYRYCSLSCSWRQFGVWPTGRARRSNDAWSAGPWGEVFAAARSPTVNIVIRRIVVGVALALVVSACGASGSDPVVQVGDRVVDEDTFFGAFVAREGPDFEFDGTLDEDVAISWAEFVVNGLAVQQSLEESGLNSDLSRELTTDMLGRAIDDGRMAELEVESPEFQLIVDVLSPAQLNLTDEQRAALDENFAVIFEQAEVADWLGTLNTETGEITPPN